MSDHREKFATQLSSNVLAELRTLAKDEGRQLQALVEEAVTKLIDERKQMRARPHVMAAYQKSHGRYASLYKELAK